MDKIISCIITYNPCLDRLEKNISSIINQVENVVIIDNGSRDYNKLLKFIEQKFVENIKKIAHIRNDSNIGIASALNQGLKYAKENNYKWLFTLDQDSVSHADIIKHMIGYYDQSDIKESIAMIGPNIIDENEPNQLDMHEEVEFPTVIITSGALTDVDKCIEVGGFLDKLFIDGVDHEICLKLRDSNYEIVKLQKAILYHQLGDLSSYPILGRNIVTSNHSALRRYYSYRNGVYLYETYKDTYPEWIKFNQKWLMKTAIKVIFLEGDKINKLRYIAKGRKDGKNNKYGKYTP